MQSLGCTFASAQEDCGSHLACLDRIVEISAAFLEFTKASGELSPAARDNSTSSLEQSKVRLEWSKLRREHSTPTMECSKVAMESSLALLDCSISSMEEPKTRQNRPKTAKTAKKLYFTSSPTNAMAERQKGSDRLNHEIQQTHERSIGQSFRLRFVSFVCFVVNGPFPRCDNGRDLRVQPRLVAAAEDETGNKIRRPARRLTQRNSHPQKIFGVHVNSSNHVPK